jgi:hypothetical protein
LVVVASNLAEKAMEAVKMAVEDRKARQTKTDPETLLLPAAGAWGAERCGRKPWRKGELPWQKPSKGDGKDLIAGVMVG